MTHQGTMGAGIHVCKMTKANRSCDDPNNKAKARTMMQNIPKAEVLLYCQGGFISPSIAPLPPDVVAVVFFATLPPGSGGLNAPAGAAGGEVFAISSS